MMKNSFFTNILTLMSGTVIAQILPILLSPWLSRIYSLEDFASLALLLPFISIGSLLATMRLDVAIVIPKTEEEAAEIIKTAFIINVITSLFFALIVFIFKMSGIVSSFFPSMNDSLLWLIPPGVFFVSSYQIMNYWSTRCKTFRNNAISKVLQSVTNLIVSITLGYVLFGAQGLIIGFVCGYFVGFLVLAYRLREKIFFLMKLDFNFLKIKQVMIKYKNFVTVNTPHAMTDIFVDQGLIYLMKYYFMEVVVGGFAFAYRYTRAPLSIITSSIYQVFYEQASKQAIENIDIRPLMLKIQRNLFFIGIVPFVVIVLFAPDIFAFVFSQEYRLAGEIARYLMPWIFMNFLVSPISSVTLIFNKQKEAFFITIIDLIFRVLAIIIGAVFWDYRYSFIFISFFCTIILIFATIWYYRIAKPKSLNESIK